MNGYLKFGAQLIATIIAALVPALSGDDHVSPSEWINVAIVGLGALAVLGAGEFPSGIWSQVKVFLAAATAGLVLLHSVLGNGVTSTEMLQILVALLGAIGVGAVNGPLVVPAATGVKA